MTDEREDKPFTKKELKEHILKEAGKTMNDAAIYKRINKLISNGSLVRIGQGLYRFNGKRRYDYFLEYPISLKVFNYLKRNYSNDLEYIVYESSTILNEFVNHLLAHSITIIEAPKLYAEIIFWDLQDHGFKNVMLNPTEEERFRYNPSIIVKNMVSKAPIKLKEHKLTIEKLVVDIVCDNILNLFYEGAEREFMIEEIFDKYAIKYDSIKTYAKRRSALEEVIKYIPEKERNYFND